MSLPTVRLLLPTLLALPLVFLSGCGKESEVASEAVGSAVSETPFFAGPVHNTEEYDSVTDNPFVDPHQQPLSTFSIDVDTASYTNVRRLLSDGQAPPAGSVRIEEFVNYFKYEYAGPSGGEHPLAVQVDAASCPWQPEHRLVRVALQAEDQSPGERKPINLVFLLDTSGSMSAANKLPLVTRTLSEMLDHLEPTDRVAIVAYAGSTGLVLPSTPVSQSGRIRDSLSRLSAGGSTNGGAGIELAYRVAQDNFAEGGVNRVVLCTDGDFNVGVTNRSDLVSLVERKAKSDVFLTIAGFGTGNLKDATMEELTNKGDGNYAYIDSLSEARKVFGSELTGTLIPVARDVKVQVDFNPQAVQAYRLIGYDNRLLDAEDFADDSKDAGELGSGQQVTALYEIVPHGVDFAHRNVDPSKYQEPEANDDANEIAETDPNAEVLTVRVRYQPVTGGASTRLDTPLVDRQIDIAEADADFRFAAAVAEFAQHLRGTKYVEGRSYDDVRSLAAAALGADPGGLRSEFLTLISKAEQLGDAE